MNVWLTVARSTAAVNILLLAGLGSIWVRNYRRHGAAHTLGLLVFATFLLVENSLWVYFYVFQPYFVAWFMNATPVAQIGLALLCGLEFIALVVLVRITWL